MKPRRASALLFQGVHGGGRIGEFFRRALLALLGIVCGVILFDRVIMPRVVRHGDTVRIPPVAGREFARAEAMLRDVGLEPVRAAGRPHADMPRGNVLEASPSVGLSVKRGRQVFLTPSLGAVSRRVPELAGLSMRMARMRLADLGLRVKRTEYAATDLVPPEEVLAMVPEAGTPVPESGEITLLVSRARAPSPYWTPDLRGRDGRSMALLLEAAGFRAAMEEGAGPAPPGTVITQDPAPGTPIWPGSRVRLDLAPGKPGRGAQRRGTGW